MWWIKAISKKPVMCQHFAGAYCTVQNAGGGKLLQIGK